MLRENYLRLRDDFVDTLLVHHVSYDADETPEVCLGLITYWTLRQCIGLKPEKGGDVKGRLNEPRQYGKKIWLDLY